jgi:hypothetical protein
MGETCSIVLSELSNEFQSWFHLQLELFYVF